MSLTISYYDDDTNFSRELEDAIVEGVNAGGARAKKPKPLDAEALLEWMSSHLPDFQGKRSKRAEKLQEQLDDTDLLFLDYDLRATEGIPFLSGERVAYIVRCHTKCRAIVMVNPMPRPTFDLRLCSVPQDSWADVWLHVNDLPNPWLWSEKRKGFAPWYWPNLAQLPAKAERRAEATKPAMKLGTLLALPTEVAKRLPKDRFTAVVGSLDDSLGEIAERRIRDDDADLEPAALRRIAAFIVAGWIDNRLLPGQDVLVDAPHACVRFPALAGKDPDKACRRDLEKFPGLKSDLKKARFPKQDWVNRNVWWLVLLENDEDVAAIDSPKVKALAFAEDASAFVNEDDDADSFTMAIATPFLERFVVHYAHRNKRDYEPAVRLLEA